MKFRTADKRLQDKMDDPKNNQWHKVFAWLPVQCNDHVYWLCNVERKRSEYYDWRFVWQYRPIERK